MSIQIQVGPEAFRFTSFTEWVNKAQGWFAARIPPASRGRHLCVDAVGRVCLIGRDFMRARDEDAFPVVVFLIDAPPTAEARTKDGNEAFRHFHDARIHTIVEAITAAAWHHRNDADPRYLRRAVEQIAKPMLQHPEAAHGWVRVPYQHVYSMLNLIDPAPSKAADGKTYVFVNPMAAEVLTRLSGEVRAMVDAMKGPHDNSHLVAVQDAEPVHTDHPMRHYDRTCPGCNPERVNPSRVLDVEDSFCPTCGHNRDTSGVCSIAEDDGSHTCQKCGANWRETLTRGVTGAGAEPSRVDGEKESGNG